MVVLEEYFESTSASSAGWIHDADEEEASRRLEEDEFDETLIFYRIPSYAPLVSTRAYAPTTRTCARVVLFPNAVRNDDHAVRKAQRTLCLLVVDKCSSSTRSCRSNQPGARRRATGNTPLELANGAGGTVRQRPPTRPRHYERPKPNSAVVLGKKNGNNSNSNQHHPHNDIVVEQATG
jgi:hypothetical protein